MSAAVYLAHQTVSLFLLRLHLASAKRAMARAAHHAAAAARIIEEAQS